VTASSVEQLPLLVLLVVRPFPGKKSLEAVDYGGADRISIQKVLESIPRRILTSYNLLTLQVVITVEAKPPQK